MKPCASADDPAGARPRAQATNASSNRIPSCARTCGSRRATSPHRLRSKAFSVAVRRSTSNPGGGGPPATSALTRALWRSASVGLLLDCDSTGCDSTRCDSMASCVFMMRTPTGDSTSAGLCPRRRRWHAVRRRVRLPADSVRHARAGTRRLDLLPRAA